jgi:multisubunit Na+/H+ antiporter MnhE subunit
MPGVGNQQPDDPGRPRLTLRRIAVWLVWWFVLAALWLLLVDRTPLAELVAGAVAAAGAATAAATVGAQPLITLHPRLAWILSAVRAAPSLFSDTVRVAVVLARAIVGRRRPTGAFRTVAADAAGDDPESTARRALTKALGSLGPNTYVVAIDHRSGKMLVHQLEPTSDVARRADPLGHR